MAKQCPICGAEMTLVDCGETFFEEDALQGAVYQTEWRWYCPQCDDYPATEEASVSK